MAIVYTLGELAGFVGGRVVGEATARIEGVATLASAGDRQISFLANPRYQQQLLHTKAGAVIVEEAQLPHCRGNALVVADPYVAYARIATLFVVRSNRVGGIHPTASVSEGATIHETAWIGPNCSIGAGVTIGSDTRLGPGCFVGDHATIGSDCMLVGNVSICHAVHIGNANIIHPGAVVGSDGFGFANQQGRWVKVPQLGGVVTGDNVEIGANTTIDRGALDDTVIEEGVKLDNQIQIAHNVRIGAHTAIAGCVGISGSTRIGCRCAIAGGVGIAGHLEIADDVTITAMSLVTKSITRPGVYSSGIPAEANSTWNRRMAYMRRLERIDQRLRKIEQMVAERPNEQKE